MTGKKNRHGLIGSVSIYITIFLVSTN